MIWLSHPVGNANVRHALKGLERGGLVPEYFTTLGWRAPGFLSRAPFLGRRLQRRNYEGFHGAMRRRPWMEILRLRGGAGAPSVMEVAADLDAWTARWLIRERRPPKAVYGYEDCAADLFQAAQMRGVPRVYELPIAHWAAATRLYREEAERLPRWAPTLGGREEPEWKLERKTVEAELADVIICPSRFVLESLPEAIRTGKRCVVAPFGAPAVSMAEERACERPATGRLRVLFAGSLTQRKGLADVFEAMRQLGREDVQLVVMGSLCAPMAFYRGEFPDFQYEPPRSHGEVMRLMRTCDLLVLPSLVEGRALVQQEAMSRGLPVIATANAGADDLILEGETGFLVPIRRPDVLAEKLAWCADNRGEVKAMGERAREVSRRASWEAYEARIASAVGAVLDGDGFREFQMP